MTQSTTTAAREVAPDFVANDLVPAPWKSLFSNEEWLIHRIVVYSTYGFMVIAIIAHILVWSWKPWLM